MELLQLDFITNYCVYKPKFNPKIIAKFKDGYLMEKLKQLKKLNEKRIKRFKVCQKRYMKIKVQTVSKCAILRADFYQSQDIYND